LLQCRQAALNWQTWAPALPYKSRLEYLPRAPEFRWL